MRAHVERHRSDRGGCLRAAVLGRTFPQELLGYLYDGTEEDLREGLHHLLRLEMLQQEQRLPEPVYRFRHALLQEAAQRALVSDERARLHRRLHKWQRLRLNRRRHAR